MTRRIIHSPTWGELQVELVEGAGDEGRPWRATLVDGPARLAHLVATVGRDEDDALRVMAEAVEQYDAQAVVLRDRAEETQPLPAPRSRMGG